MFENYSVKIFELICSIHFLIFQDFFFFWRKPFNLYFGISKRLLVFKQLEQLIYAYIIKRLLLLSFNVLFIIYLSLEKLSRMRIEKNSIWHFIMWRHKRKEECMEFSYFSSSWKIIYIYILLKIPKYLWMY